MRRFAIYKGCKSISIIKPFDIMSRISRQIGFVDESIEGSLVGKSIAAIHYNNTYEECDDCPAYKDLLHPINTENISFLLSE